MPDFFLFCAAIASVFLDARVHIRVVIVLLRDDPQKVILRAR